MEILKILGRLILFLVGGVFLASGLFCGVIGATSISGWMIGLIGLAFAALGGYMIASSVGLTGKKNALPPTPDDSGTTQG